MVITQLVEPQIHIADMKPDVPALTGLRGVAALWVLAFHSWVLTNALPGLGHDLFGILAGAGYLGVDLFFVLSGFVIALNYAPNRLHRSLVSYLEFLWKRLARIWPVHLATSILLGVVILASVAVGVPLTSVPALSEFFFSMTLTHAWAIPVPGVWNAVSWSISSEWAAYLCFPAIAWFALRLRSRLAIVSVSATLFVALGLAIGAETYPRTMSYGMHRVAAEFTAGVLLFRLWQLSSYGRTSTTWGAAAATALFTLIVGGGLLHTAVGFVTALQVLPVLAAVVVAGLAFGDGALVRCLSGGLMQYLGRISYSLYLAHGPIMAGAKAVLIEYGWGAAPGACLLVVATALALSLALAHWFYGSIEEPARRAMRSVSLAHPRPRVTGADDRHLGHEERRPAALNSTEVFND